MPVVLIVWPKESENEAPVPDTRVVCVSANEVQPGSKVPNAAPVLLGSGAMLTIGWASMALVWNML